MSLQENDPRIILSEIFPRVSQDQINLIVNMVNEGNVDPFEFKLEAMINLLSESGDSTLINIEEEGAVGYGDTSNNHRDLLLNNLVDMFPDAPLEYISDLVENYSDNSTIIEILSKGEYTKKELDYLDIWDHLKDMLPNIDPSFLREKAQYFVTNGNEISTFVNEAMEKNDFPTMQGYLKDRKNKRERTLYEKFDVHRFLEVIPDPEGYFADKNNRILLVKDDEIDYTMAFLYNQYPIIKLRNINNVFKYYEKDMYLVCNRLDKFPRDLKRPRKPIELTEITNVPLLQEISFLKHRKIIKQFIKMKDDNYRAAKENARKNNILQTCQCCFDDELIPDECFLCDKNCIFCKDCVKKGSESVIGMGQMKFPCFNNCGSEFSTITLRMVLDRKTFEGLAHRMQLEDIKNAEIDGLETCIFCNEYSAVPSQGDKIFKCENSDCLKETCLECRHEAHVPLRCNEIEYDEDVRMRTFIENEMTKALVRECHSCKKTFLKSSGCNKITCSCGAKMCYVCGQAVNDYTHFGDSVGRCPLYTDNLNQFHVQRVLQGAKRAKDQLGINGQSNTLKFDPTVNIEQFFNSHQSE